MTNMLAAGRTQDPELMVSNIFGFKKMWWLVLVGMMFFLNQRIRPYIYDSHIFHIYFVCMYIIVYIYVYILTYIYTHTTYIWCAFLKSWSTMTDMTAMGWNHQSALWPVWLSTTDQHSWKYVECNRGAPMNRWNMILMYPPVNQDSENHHAE